MKLCIPALVYLILSIIGLIIVLTQEIIARETHIFILLFKALFIGLWTWLLSFICSKGHIGVAWFLVFLPLILMIIVIIVAASVAIKAVKKEIENNKA